MIRTSLRPLLVALLLAGLARSAEPVLPPIPRLDVASAEGIAVLSGGRVKPLRIAAEEGLEALRGRSGLGPGWSPLESWFALALHADTLADSDILLCEHRPLRLALGLPEKGRWASFRQLAGSAKLRDLVATAELKERDGERLGPMEKAAVAVNRRVERFEEIRQGLDWRLMPGPKGDEGTWRLPQEISLEEIAADPALRGRVALFRRLLLAYASADARGFDSAAAVLVREPPPVGPAMQPVRLWRLQAELFLVHRRPFRAAWILLSLAFVAAYAAQASEARRIARGLERAAWGLAGLGLAATIAGFSLRVLVSERSPVTNMYETTLWAGLGVVLIGLALSAIYRSRLLFASMAASAAVVFVLADNLPSVLDPSIRPLVPVLRSNGWLVVHVLTVTLSYAAFLVAMALGNLGLAQAFRGGDRNGVLRDLSHFTHRAMQLGLVLLVAGIVLGGVWADQSWGRFWGWDPKETWSLVAALGYLLVLHGRFAGRLGTWGTLMGAVLAFYGVVMAWYGVNFVLASGLHSYGFSQGGAAAMGVYVLVQGAWAAAASWRWSRRGRC